MKLTQIIISLMASCILLQPPTTVDKKSESSAELKEIFKLLLQASQDLEVTVPEKIKPNRPIEAGIAATWIDDERDEACSISLDKIDEHTSIVMFSHAKPDLLKDYNLDTEATRNLALIRHVTNLISMKKAFVNRQAEKNGLSFPAKP